MPFKSKAQKKFMYATHPDIAQEFQESTPNDAALPDKVSIKSSKPRTRRTSARDFDRGMLHSSEANKVK